MPGRCSFWPDLTWDSCFLLSGPVEPAVCMGEKICFIIIDQACWSRNLTLTTNTNTNTEIDTKTNTEKSRWIYRFLCPYFTLITQPNTQLTTHQHHTSPFQLYSIVFSTYHTAHLSVSIVFSISTRIEDNLRQAFNKTDKQLHLNSQIFKTRHRTNDGVFLQKETFSKSLGHLNRFYSCGDLNDHLSPFPFSLDFIG